MYSQVFQLVDYNLELFGQLPLFCRQLAVDGVYFYLDSDTLDFGVWRRLGVI